MIQLTIIRIEGYGPWTVTLGNDREAQLQMLQAKIYHDVQRLFSAKDGIVFFNRFDEYFAITNGLGADDHREIQRELARAYKDLSMSMAIGSGATAFEANLDAYRARKEGRLLDTGARIFGSVRDADAAQIMHVDVDSSTVQAADLAALGVDPVRATVEMPYVHPDGRVDYGHRAFAAILRTGPHGALIGQRYHDTPREIAYRNAMHMIRHDHKFIQFYTRVMAWDFTPAVRRCFTHR